MTTDEINRYIHTTIMRKIFSGSCGRTYGNRGYCTDCNPDYCSDASPRSLLNEVCEKLDAVTLERAILDEIRDKKDRVVGFADGSVGLSAQYIARACVEAHKSEDTN